MNIQMIPRSILMLVGRSIQKHDLTLIPSLIGLAYVGEIQWCSAEWRISGNLWHASLISLAAVRWIVLVPDVDWCLLALLTCRLHHMSINHIQVEWWWATRWEGEMGKNCINNNFSFLWHKRIKNNCLVGREEEEGNVNISQLEMDILYVLYEIR